MPSIDALGHGAGDKRIEILRGIAATGSISQAAREAGVSYKAAWQAIDTLTNLAGVALVRRAVGGAGGGGASLTAQGTRLLALAEAFDAARHEVHARWLSADEAGATLSRLALRTSMRNQLPATVERLETTGRIVRVVMRLDARPKPSSRPVMPRAVASTPDATDVDAGTHPADADLVVARITRESAELLGLRPGLSVIALCKATAVRVDRPAPSLRTVVDAASAHESASAINRLQGSVAGVTRGEGGDELAVALAGGLQLVGFAAGGAGLRTRQRVRASIDEAALVVALAG